MTQIKGRKKDDGGYLQVRLSDVNGNRKNYMVHRLVANTFIPNTDNKITVNHINGIKYDNRIENLEWATYSENNIHAYRNSLKSDNIKLVSLNSLNNKIIDVYYSISEAERKTNINRNVISKMIKEKYSFKDIKFLKLNDFINIINNLEGINYEH